MIEEIYSRRSIRRYNSQQVDSDKILHILDCARVAPSSHNTQPWHFIIVTNEETKEKLADVSHKQEWMKAAPVYIVCVADIRSRVDINIALDEETPNNDLKKIILDTAISIQNMVLEAESIGLSTCWVAWFNQKDIRPILDIPEDKYIVAIITLGYSDHKPNARPRKKLEEIISYEKWTDAPNK